MYVIFTVLLTGWLVAHFERMIAESYVLDFLPWIEIIVHHKLSLRTCTGVCNFEMAAETIFRSSPESYIVRRRS
jgi:hypothetical protein